MIRHPLFLTLLSFALTAAIMAADPAPTTPAAPAGEAAVPGSADEAWKQVEASQKQPAAKPTTRDEALALAQTWLAGQRTAADAFAKAFSKDSRRWQAKMVSARAGLQEQRVLGKVVTPEAERAKFDEIVNAAEAPVPVKAEAAFMRAMTYGVEFKAKPASYLTFHQAAADFLAKYPAHPLTLQMQEMDLRSLADDPTPQSGELLQKYAASPDTKLSDIAKKIGAKRERMAEIKSQPLELKFTSIANKDVDLAMLRGKVVQVDFWASEVAQCKAEMPGLVATYEKLHPKGFEIVGISLDQNKEKLQEAIKKYGIEWPQYFDGGGFKNKISSGFLIDSLPTSWLIDKKGNLRHVGLRGAELEAAVQKLLAE